MIHWFKKKTLTFLSYVLILCGIFTQAQEAVSGDPGKGYELFDKHCKTCHSLDAKMTGPALGGVVDRLKKDQNLDVAWLQQWISNNKKLRESGDAYANKIFAEYNKTEMNIFEGTLSETDINDILAYTSNPEEGKKIVEEAKKKAEEEKQKTANANKGGNSNSTLLIISLLVISTLLLWLLLKVNALVKLSKDPELSIINENKIKSFSDFYSKNTLLSQILLLVLLIVSLWGVWSWLMGIGVDKGYRPEQPIYFSHMIHAGVNKIDCQTCHTSAKYGKVSEIPPLSSCMKCHKVINEYKGEYVESGKTKEFYTQEIQKIYDHVGWNGTAYTGKTKPIKWIRVHNMPDFVYFNHSQHITVGEKAIMSTFNADPKNKNNQIDVVCKACHGQIDTMNVVEMANDFTMGWCVDCHRKTEVDMSNGYNAHYFKNLHDKIKTEYPMSDGKVTVDAIGGLECGKCHY